MVAGSLSHSFRSSSPHLLTSLPCILILFEQAKKYSSTDVCSTHLIDVPPWNIFLASSGHCSPSLPC